MGIEIVILITNLRFDIVLNIAIKMSEGIYQKRNQLSVRKLLFNVQNSLRVIMLCSRGPGI